MIKKYLKFSVIKKMKKYIALFVVSIENLKNLKDEKIFKEENSIENIKNF